MVQASESRYKASIALSPVLLHMFAATLNVFLGLSQGAPGIASSFFTGLGDRFLGLRHHAIHLSSGFLGLPRCLCRGSLGVAHLLLRNDTHALFARLHNPVRLRLPKARIAVGEDSKGDSSDHCQRNDKDNQGKGSASRPTRLRFLGCRKL